MNTKNNTGKLLVAMLAMAVIFAGAAVVLSSEDSNAASNSEITYIGGEIKVPTNFVDGSIVVVDKDLSITKGASLTIETGAAFTVKEGVTVTIENGSIQVEPGATVTVDGNIIVKSDGALENNAVGVKGFVLNGSLTVQKGGEITNIDMTSPADNSTENKNASSLTFTGNGSRDVASGVTYGTPNVKETTNDSGEVVVKLTNSDWNQSLPYHMNGAGTYGYWVGVKVTGNNIIKGEIYTITLDGRAAKEAADANNAVYVYILAGSIVDVSIKGPGMTTAENFILDASGVEIDGPAGQIVLGASSNVIFESSKTSQSFVGGQIFSLNNGAKLNLDTAITDDVIVETLSGNNIIRSSATIVAGENAGDEPKMTKLVFGTESKSAGTIIIGQDAEGKDVSSTKYNYSILTVSGDVGSNIILTVNNSTYSGFNEYDADEKEKLDAPIRGIVKIASGETLSVGENATFETEAYSVLNIDGKLSVSGKKDSEAKANIYGISYVSGEVTVADSDKATLDLNKGSNLTNRTAYITIVGDGKVSIVGYSPSSSSGWNTESPKGVNGVAYEIEDGSNDVYVISSLNAALAADTDEITIWGYDAVAEGESGVKMLASPFMISEDVTISDVTVLFAYKTIVSEGVTLTFDESADIDIQVNAVIEVDGIVVDYTMYGFVEEISNEDVAIDAEVRSIDADETYYKYTTLKNALSTAVAGDVIELFGDADVYNTMTIPADITVKTSGKTLTVHKNSTLVVDGILDLVLDANGLTDEGAVAIESKGTSSFDSDGKLTVGNIVVGSSNQITKDSNPQYVAGFYVTDATIGDYENEDMILAPAVAAANSASISNPTVNATTSYSGDLTFDAGEDSGTISVLSKLTVGTITLKNYSIEISKGTFTGTVATANGSVSLTSITTKDENAKVVLTDEINNDASTDVLSISGTPVKIDKDGNTNTSVTDNVAAISVVSGNVYVDGTLDVSALSKFTINADATLTIDGTVKFNTLTIDGTVKVNGELSSNAANDSADTSYIEILGTLDVKIATVDDNSSGTLKVQDVYVGIMKNDIQKTTGADAAFNGKNVDVKGIVYVSSGATISSDIIKNKKSTEFYIEDVLWITAYNMGGNNAIVSKAPVKNAIFLGWTDSDGKPIYKNENDKTYSTSIAIDDYSKVYADVNYKIYKVTVLGDNGIGTVAIDGVVLYKESNKFVAMGLTAGEHTLTYELKNGYTGTVKVTIDGKDVTSNKFTLSGTSDADRALDIYLSGTTQIEYDNATNTDSGSDDGMGLTDILLIVLVVLIAVMAVMVALRLMRS